MSTARVIFVLLMAAFTFSGCAGGVASAAIGFVPRMVSNVMSSDEVSTGERRAVGNDRGEWRRVVLPIEGATSAAGDEFPVQVIWDIPVRVGPGVESLVALANAACLMNSRPARDWALVGSAGQATGEAWRVQEAPSSTGGALPVLRAEQLGQRLGVAADYRVTWLLFTPVPGTYRIRVAWEASEPAELNAAPCIDAWAALPLGSAVAATTGTVAGPEQRQQRPPRTPYEAFSQQQSAPLSPTPGEPSRAIAESLGLTGIPAYDIVQLHRQALAIEEGGRSLASTDGLRAERLRILQQTEGLRTAEHRAFCQATVRHGLGERSLQVWGGEATVPPRYAQVCR